MQVEVTVTQADLRFADDWNIECRHCSEYDGDFQNDFAQAVAEYRIEATRALEAQIAELRELLRQCRDDTIGPLVAGGDGGTYVVRHLSPTTINAITSALQNKDATTTPKFTHGDRVTKTKGSSWTGLVVGTYRTSLTPEGYAVESENEPGSVQIYPASALERIDK